LHISSPCSFVMGSSPFFLSSFTADCTPRRSALVPTRTTGTLGACSSISLYHYFITCVRLEALR
jgi:hypothetical protein